MEQSKRKQWAVNLDEETHRIITDAAERQGISNREVVKRALAAMNAAKSRKETREWKSARSSRSSRSCC